jgi:hypothetical protein
MQLLPALRSSLQVDAVRDLPAWKRQLQDLRVNQYRLSGRIVHYLLSRNMTVFTLDFAGCGLS